MTAQAMTYDSLINDIQVYCERTDQPFVDQLDRFIMLAEDRISKEAKGLGLKRVVKANFTAGNPVVAKPDRWRETCSFSYVNASQIVYLKLRQYEYCRSFWPNPTLQGAPRYYADYNFENFVIAATPDSAYQFELSYYERPEPLSVTAQSNWTTQNAPALLLAACLLECQSFLKIPERLQEFQSAYDRALMGLRGEDEERRTDVNAGEKK